MTETTIQQRACQWVVGDDTGLSSKALWSVMMYVEKVRGYPHPSDGADLGRCVRLLDLIPEWRRRLPEMARVSPYWAALVPEWDNLAEPLREELAGGPRGSTYKAMRALLDPVESADKSVVRLGPRITLRTGFAP